MHCKRRRRRQTEAPIGRMERHKDTCNVHMASAMRDVASVLCRLETTQEYRVTRSDKFYKRCTRTAVTNVSERPDTA